MKRFTETTKWADSWFSELPLKHKAGWLYCLDACDCAGFLELNQRILSFNIGEEITLTEFLAAMDGRIVKLRNGKHFIPKFIGFQYPRGLKKGHNPHEAVFTRLSSNDVSYPFSAKDFSRLDRGLAEARPRDQDTDTDTDKDKDTGKGKGKDMVKGKATVTVTGKAMAQDTDAECEVCMATKDEDVPF